MILLKNTSLILGTALKRTVKVAEVVLNNGRIWIILIEERFSNSLKVGKKSCVLNSTLYFNPNEQTDT